MNNPNRKPLRLTIPLLLAAMLVAALLISVIALPASQSTIVLAAEPNHISKPGLASILINEIRVDQTGTDNDEYFEVAGLPGASLDGLTYLVLGDGTGGSGVIEVVVDLSGQTIPADGYFLAAETTFTIGSAPDLIASLNFENSDNVTHLLVSGFTGTNGQDLDTNDDGVLDVTPWSGIVDLIALILQPNPPTTTEWHYGPPTVGPDGSFVPGHVYRCKTGWQIGAFDPLSGQDTPGALNLPCGLLNRVTIEKDAPSLVASGSLFTYTIQVENLLSYDLSGVVITDRVPADTTFAYALDGGVESGGEVSWSIPTLPAFQTVQARFAVTATLTDAHVLNDQYAVYASNYLTPTFGAPLATLVGSEISIHHIQGEADVSPFVGRTVTSVDGVVTSLMNNGFFMQEPNPDVVDETSEGIFVYLGAAPTVAVGDGVSVDGLVNEYFTHTELDSTQVVTFTTMDTITPTEVDLPVPLGETLESYEGMLVTFPEELTASQNYFQGRYGQITMSSDGRMYNPTNGNGLGDTFELDMRRMLILDDGTTLQNIFPIPYIGDDNTHRAGDTVSGLTGVIDYGEINSGGGRYYRLQPVGPVTFTRDNPRTPIPEATSGTLKVASFNVLNYFNGDGLGGGFPTTRGASTLEEFVRQRTKIITAMLAIDADVYGLIEIENDGDDALSAIQDLVNGLNDSAGAGTYALVADPVFIGTDEIKQAFIYKPATVTLVGSSDSSTDPVFSRPPVAQTFQDNASGETFTAVVNHFKAKGSCPADPNDPNADQGDGQGCWNLLRVQQAQALLAYIDTLETASGDPDVLVIGDLNAYGEEDPILTLMGGGLTNELAKHVPAAERYSYIFDGLSGYLDHALSTGKLSRQISGATIWHINTDEPSVIDYNTEFKSQDLYTSTPYRSSDHDPVVIGITPGMLAASFESSSPAPFGQTMVFTNTTTGLSPISYEWSFGDQTAVVSDVNPVHLYSVVGSYTVVMTATNPLGTQVVTGTVQVTGSKIFLPQAPQSYIPVEGEANSGGRQLFSSDLGAFAWLRRRG